MHSSLYQDHVRANQSMSESCQGHVRVMSGSCQDHVSVMSGSCLGHVRAMTGSCQLEIISIVKFTCRLETEGFSVLLLLSQSTKIL